MKRTIVFLMALIITLSFLTACGVNSSNNGGNSSDGNSAGNTNPPTSSNDPPTKTPSGESVDRLNPPAWLIGEWVTEGGANPQGEVIMVTEHNVVVSSGTLDFSWQINNMGLDITETTDDNHYRLEYPWEDYGTISYDFRLQEDGSMILMLFDSSPTMLYTKK